MRIGSLFSGIGLLELGLERAGVGRTVWQVEKEPWCREILARHWPDAARYADVRHVGVDNLAPADVICGGFPCQDVSTAGSGAGIDGPETGLYREALRVVAEVQPRYVVLENVSAIRSRGGVRVVNEIAALGYSVAWCTLSAAGVGAPHRRSRWFALAYADAERRPERVTAALTSALGQPPRGHAAGGPHGVSEPRLGGNAYGRAPGLDGPQWPATPGQPQHAGEPPRTVPHRPDVRRLRALGNAVMPQVAEIVGRWLLALDSAEVRG